MRDLFYVTVLVLTMLAFHVAVWVCEPREDDATTYWYGDTPLTRADYDDLHRRP